MKGLIKLEEFAFFILSIFAFRELGLLWWWFPLLLFTPDLSMLGYLAGPRFGANAYNIVHHRALSIALFLLGIYWGQPSIMLIAIILFAHSSLDRIFGYGFKYTDSFQNTHLGRIGKQAG